MPDTPTTKYAKSGDVHIAYQVVGDGPNDLVFVPGWVSHVEYAWEDPFFAHFLRPACHRAGYITPAILTVRGNLVQGFAGFIGLAMQALAILDRIGGLDRRLAGVGMPTREIAEAQRVISVLVWSVGLLPPGAAPETVRLLRNGILGQLRRIEAAEAELARARRDD